VALDDLFDPKSAGRAAGRAARGGGRSSGDFADFLSKYGEGIEGEEEDTFTPKTPSGLPKRLATYAHGYSYDQGKYPGGVPRYFDGHEALPANLPPHNIAALQRLLVDAGLLKNPRWGFWDPVSQDAYKAALADANAKGTDVATVLTTYAEAAAIGEAETRGPFVPEPLIFETTNKQDLHKVFRSAVIEQLGKGWTQEQIAELVDAYNWKEVQVQNDLQMAQRRAAEAEWYGQAPPDEQITVGSVPAPETFIEDMIRQRDPEGYQENQGLGLLMGILGEGWGNPTSSPGTMF
jgi:hypothetical protein